MLKEPLHHLESRDGHLRSDAALLITHVNNKQQFYHSSELYNLYPVATVFLASPHSIKLIFIKNWEHVVFKNKPSLAVIKLLILECFILTLMTKIASKTITC